jgi:hypothetical protein
MEDLSSEVSKLLFSTFSDDNSLLNKEKIIHLWSLDFQWFNPENSDLALSYLIKKKWLLNTDDGIFPNPNLDLIHPSLGWKPLLNNILNIPECDVNVDKSLINKDINLITNYAPIVLNSEVEEIHEDMIKKLINFVSINSGLSKREVVRRSQRKRLALGPITLWMCVALLAREQGLKMKEIVYIIEQE